MSIPPRQVRVLLVEDNPHVAELLTDGFESASRRELAGKATFEFDICQDGQAALARLTDHPPDLVILDLYLPIMDGATFLRHLRAHPRVATTPVIALSAGGPGAREMALSAGANIFFDKPIRLADVLRAATQLLS